MNSRPMHASMWGSATLHETMLAIALVVLLAGCACALPTFAYASEAETPEGKSNAMVACSSELEESDDRIEGESLVESDGQTESESLAEGENQAESESLAEGESQTEGKGLAEGDSPIGGDSTVGDSMAGNDGSAIGDNRVEGSDSVQEGSAPQGAVESEVAAASDEMVDEIAVDDDGVKDSGIADENTADVETDAVPAAAPAPAAPAAPAPAPAAAPVPASQAGGKAASQSKGSAPEGMLPQGVAASSVAVSSKAPAQSNAKHGAAAQTPAQSNAKRSNVSTQASASAGIAYRVHVQNKGWMTKATSGATAGTTGQRLRIEALRLWLTGVDGGLQYQAYVQGLGWQRIAADGSIAGTTGKGRRIEALRIELYGEASQLYNVRYRAHVQGVGWQSWVSDGKIAGLAGDGKRLEALQVELAKRSKETAKQNDGIVDVRYRGHVQSVGWQAYAKGNEIAGTTGRSLRVEALNLSLDPGTLKGGIQYRVHVQGIGWMPWVSDGTLAGTTGQSKRIEAIQVRLTGNAAKQYDVAYRAHVQGIGWQQLVRNGATAGTTGQSKRIEALRIQLLPKGYWNGWDGSGKSWSYYKSGEKCVNEWVVTSQAPMAGSASGSQRYWIDGNGKLAVSRLIDIRTTRDKAAGYYAYALDKGYVLRGELPKDGVVMLADENGRLATEAGWLDECKYSPTRDWYWYFAVKAKDGPYTVAKTGFYKDGGETYYSDPKTGRMLHDQTIKVSNKWYAIDPHGRVTSVGSRQDIIEKAVKWAIAIAKDDSHGYSQGMDLRWGPDYDCSSFVVSAYKSVGLDLGAASWTGNMKSELTSHGFKFYTDLGTLHRGDILWVHGSAHQHTELYIGSSQLVGATSSETGGTMGRTGDQTGREIRVGDYYDYGWQGFFRFVG